MIFKFHNKLQLLRKIAAWHPLTPHTNKHTTNSHFTQASVSHTSKAISHLYYKKLIHCTDQYFVHSMFSLTNLHSRNIFMTTNLNLFLLFPGYEGVPEFFNDLLNHIISVLQDHSSSDPSAPPPPGQLPALDAGERNCAPSQECCGMLGKESDSSPWIVEGDGGLKGPRQRLGCNTAMSPNFQQHCVSTIATKASSQ